MYKYNNRFSYFHVFAYFFFGGKLELSFLFLINIFSAQKVISYAQKFPAKREKRKKMSIREREMNLLLCEINYKEL
jgi:hypothetical protein